MPQFNGSWILAATICLAAAPVHAETKFGGNSHCYEFRSRPDGIDWFTAQSECEADGGYLATITSSAENDFIYGLIIDDGPWIGGFQPSGSSEPGGGWQWVTGEPFVFTNWEVGEPNDGLGGPREDGIHFFDSGPEPTRNAWNDFVRSNSGLRAYVFEADFCDEDGDGLRPPADCDDSDSTVSPNGIELPGNFIDEDCNGDLGDCDPCFPWRNHGEYIRCTSRAAEALVDSGDITQEKADQLVSDAARSDIGKKGYTPPECQ